MIDQSELENWITTEEGAAWLEGQKRPLLAKRDELLESLRKGNAAAAQAAQRTADLEKTLTEEREATGRAIVDRELSRLLKESRVMEPAIPGVIAELKETHGIQVKADGRDRRAVGMMEGKQGMEEADLESIVKTWAASERAREVFLHPGSSGSGALGGSHRSAGNSMNMSAFEALPPDKRMEFIRQGGFIQ